MTAPHTPEVVPYVGIADEWAVRCRTYGCVLFERYASQEDAERRRDEHRQETS